MDRKPMNYQDPMPSDYIQQGRTEERERILALLRELRNHAQERKINTNVNINRIIEIIKGPNK